MPYKPPICPAYAQSQCLTLSPIPEAKSKVNSPDLSIGDSDRSSLFSGFGWSSASEGLSPLFNEQPQTFSALGDPSADSLKEAIGGKASATTLAISSPAFLDRLEQLNLWQQHGDNGRMPSISSTLSLVQPTPLNPNNLSPGLAGLGFTCIDADTQRVITAATPFNTPARPSAPKPIVTVFDPFLVQMKLIALHSPPLTPPYDEDNANNADNAVALANENAGSGPHLAEMDEENTPLHMWVQNRIEEAKRREEYERDLNEVLSSASPLGIKAGTSGEAEASQHPRDLSDGSETAEDISSDEELADSTVVLVTDARRVSVRDSCAIATLKRKSRLANLFKEAGPVNQVDNEGLPGDSMDIDVDEFGIRLDTKEEMDLTEVAMKEDRSSLKYSIFSPTSRLPARRSVSFAQPEVTQVKTFSPSSGLATGIFIGSGTGTSNKHKRKASVTSLFSTGSADSERASLPAPGRAYSEKGATRNGRSLSTGSISTHSSNNSYIRNDQQGHYHKRARRSSSLASSLAFTSNSLTPIFSTAFLKSMGNTSNTTTSFSKEQPGSTVAETPEGFHDAPEAIFKSLKDTIEKSSDIKQDNEYMTEFGAGENKENTGVKMSLPPAPRLLKKRSFGMNLSLSFRGKTS